MGAASLPQLRSRALALRARALGLILQLCNKFSIEMDCLWNGLLVRVMCFSNVTVSVTTTSDTAMSNI